MARASVVMIPGIQAASARDVPTSNVTIILKNKENVDRLSSCCNGPFQAHYSWYRFERLIIPIKYYAV